MARKINNWIIHCKKYAKEHNIKYCDALNDVNCKNSYKNGEGFKDVLNVVKNAANSDIGKAVLNKGVEIASDYAKKKINGQGLFGDIGGVVGLRGGPIGSVVAKFIGDNVDKKLGTGIRRKKSYKVNGGALMP